MNNQQTQINPKYVLLEQSQTVHTLTDEVIKLRAYVNQLEEENAQLKANAQPREDEDLEPKEERDF
ncbi:NAD dependent DNA ligase subunit A [Bacillus phage vB_BcgM]|nr:NAD dependent DNA ligase subunit A [Bacillus phage vB_BcgM]